MKRFLSFVLATLGCLFVPVVASFGAGVTGFIDFESQSVGNLPGDSLTINAAGIPVTFSGRGLNIRQFDAPFPNSKVLSTEGDIEVITVTFGPNASLNYVEFENIINGRFTAEVDVITGQAFNSANVQIDMETSAATIHRLDGPGIFRVLYDDDNVGGGYVLDNFRFEIVPEPSTLLTAGCAVGLLSCKLMRRRETGRPDRRAG